MQLWLDYNDYSAEHVKDLHREAAEERLANRLPHKPGLLAQALKRLTGHRDE